MENLDKIFILLFSLIGLALFLIILLFQFLHSQSKHIQWFVKKDSNKLLSLEVEITNLKGEIKTFKEEGGKNG